MTRGLIFDYGGTIDTRGDHWGKVLWKGYERCEIPITEEQFREAYVHAERTLGRNPIIQPSYTFRKTLDMKLRIEMEHLMTQGYWNVSEEEYKAKHDQLLDLLELLEMLYREGIPAVLASSTKTETVIRELIAADLFGYFKSIIESAVVGIRKPDPRLFGLGVEALGLPAGDVTVVGDSFYKDILPAKKIGCHTIWIKGLGWTDEQYDETVPDKVIERLDELIDIFKENK